MKRQFSRTVSGFTFALMVSATLFAPSAYAVTDEEIAAFVEANKGDPAKIAEAMEKHGVDADRIKKAGNYTDEQISDYVTKSGNNYLKEAEAKSKGRKLSDKQIDSYIKDNIKNPSAIAKAMNEYGVDLDRIQKATGYSREEMTDFINNSKSGALKNSLASWKPSKTTPEFDKLPEYMKASDASGQGIAVIRDLGDIDKLPIWDSMHPNAAAAYKQQLKDALSKTSEGGDSVVMGFGGMNFKVPSLGDPQHAYPDTSAADIAAMKDKLKPLQDANSQAVKALQACEKSGKDCTKERNTARATGDKAFAMMAKIESAQADARVRSTDDENEKLTNSIHASYMANNALSQCLNSTKNSASECGELADMAKKHQKALQSAAANLLEDCIKTKGGGAACGAERVQSDAQDASMRSIEEKITNLNNTTEDRSTRKKSTAAKITGNAAPITITLPAEGEKELANGYSVDANGVIKDANDKFVAKLSDSGKLTDMAGKASDALSTSQLSDLFKSQPPVDNYARCEKIVQSSGCGSYATVAKGPSPVPAVAQAPTNDQFVQKNGYVAATDTGEVVKQTVTNTQINDFIRGNLKDPAKIAEAMKKYNVDLERIRIATGYSRQEMIDYINKSDNAELKANLTTWNRRQPQTGSTGGAGGMNKVALQNFEVKSASDIDKLPIWKNMHPDAVASNKKRISDALNGQGGLVGIDTYQISIGGGDKTGAQHTTPLQPVSPTIASPVSVAAQPSTTGPIHNVQMPNFKLGANNTVTEDVNGKEVVVGRIEPSTGKIYDAWGNLADGMRLQAIQELLAKQPNVVQPSNPITPVRD